MKQDPRKNPKEISKCDTWNLVGTNFTSTLLGTDLVSSKFSSSYYLQKYYGKYL